MAKSGIGNWLILAIGYLLSPLSWWNDAFINLPIAYIFASLLSLVNRSLFSYFLIIGYWLTNLAGIFLLSFGTARLGRGRTTTRRFLLYLLATGGYTILALLLSHFHLIKPPWEYWR